MPSHDLLCPDNGYFTVLLFFTSGFWRDRSSRSGTGVLLFNFLYHSWVRTLMSVQMKAFALRILFWSNVLLSTKPCLHILCCTKHLNVMTSGWRNFPVSLFWRTCGFSLFIFFLFDSYSLCQKVKGPFTLVYVHVHFKLHKNTGHHLCLLCAQVEQKCSCL